jgi:hypothetical protein
MSVADTVAMMAKCGLPDGRGCTFGPADASEVKDASAKEIKQESYDQKLVPLRRVVVDNYAAIMDSLATCESKDDVTVVALRASLQTLNGLWHMPDANWHSVRERVMLGMVKETKNHGNTSVSMGLAVRYFAANATRSGVAFLNCGTGGIKYQYYRKDCGIIYVALEHKPKDGASPNAMELPCVSFVPKKALESIKNRDLLNNETGVFRNKVSTKFSMREFKDSYMPIGHCEDEHNYESCETFAFITGTIREHYEKQSFQGGADMQGCMVQYFYATTPGSAGVEIKFIGTSYFLTQEVEGDNELSGTSKMYENLEAAGLIPPGSRVIASFGIGRGSTQLTWVNPTNGMLMPVNQSVGMNKPDELKALPWSVIPILDRILPEIITFANACQTPADASAPHLVIALKSGCMLFLESSGGADTLQTLTCIARPNDEAVMLLRNMHTQAGEFRRNVSQAFFQYSADMSEALDLPMMLGNTHPASPASAPKVIPLNEPFKISLGREREVACVHEVACPQVVIHGNVVVPTCLQ